MVSIITKNYVRYSSLKSTFGFDKASLAIVPFGNFASPQRLGSSFVIAAICQDIPPPLEVKPQGENSIIDKTLPAGRQAGRVAATPEVPKDSMAHLAK